MTSSTLRQPTTLLISHGFQKAYERGFSNALAAHGVDVLLVSSDATDYARLDRRLRTLNLRGSQDPRRNKFIKTLNQFKYHARLLAVAWRQRRRQLHVIGLIEPYWLCGLFEGAWFRLVCQHYVLTIHDLLPHDRHTRLNRRVAAWVYQFPQRIVVHTARMRDELVAKFDVAPTKVIIMEHGIEPSSAVAPRVRPQASSHVTRLLFFGAIAQYKGLDILLDALTLTPSTFTLTIAGRCVDDALAADLRRRIERHSLGELVFWENVFVSEERIAKLFGEADILVLPYRHIDQSGVLFQALRFGTPVLATRVGAFADYVTPDLGELCLPEPQDMCNALLRLQRRLGSVDRAKIAAQASKFEWFKTVQPVVDAYVANQ